VLHCGIYTSNQIFASEWQTVNSGEPTRVLRKMILSALFGDWSEKEKPEMTDGEIKTIRRALKDEPEWMQTRSEN
jgi:hypothetical protein